MVAGFGELWVTVSGVSGGEGIHQDALVEVDPQTMDIVKTIGVPTVPTWEVAGGGLLATDDAVWIAGSTRAATGDVATLVRVDPATGATQISKWAGANWFADVASDGTAIWLLGQDGPHPVVTRFDPATETFAGDVKLSGDEPRHIVAVPGAVIASQLTWEGGSGPCLSLASVDPSMNPSLRAEFPADPCSEQNTVGTSPFIVGSDIWTTYKGVTFTTVDPTTAEPLPVESPPYAPVNPRSRPVASDTGVWFGDYPGGNGSQPDILTRFDPTANTVEPTDVRFGWSVAVAGDGGLWAMGWDGSLTEIVLDAAPSAPSITSTVSPGPSETATGRDVFAHGTDPVAGSWQLFTEQTTSGPVLGVAVPTQQSYTVKLEPLGDKTFGSAWSITGFSTSDRTLLLAQVVAPTTTRAEIRLDDGSVYQGELVDLPSDLIGPAKVFVAGFKSTMSAEGQTLDPNGVVLAFGAAGQELSRRRLAQ
jgi:hypothetical protein